MRGPRAGGRISRIAGFVFILLAFCCGSAQAAVRTQIQLVLSADAARPGTTIWAGLHMTMPPPWHLYWRNGGDAGEPPRVKWDLPPGVTAGELQWPVPLKDIDKSGEFSLITYVYKNEVVLPVAITLAASVPPGPVTIKASVHWMECADICVFGDADATASLTVGTEDKPSASAPLIEQWRGKVPKPAAGDATAAWESTEVSSNSRPVVISWKSGATPADFYPYANTNFDVGGATETLPAANGWLRLRKGVQTNSSSWPERLQGILVGRVGSADPTAVEVDLPLAAPSASTLTTPGANGSLAIKLALAFLGGLILNVMPCVLPVIALKILGFVSQSAQESGRVRLLGLVYGAGVLVSFVALALLAIGVRRAGGVANWGDLFRHPGVQMGLTVLMTLIALNLFGVFEVTLSGRALGAASELAGRQGAGGAFFNGVLATLLATPCTAPYLTAALAFAFTQSAAVILLVFLAVGAGLAFPFVILCLQPRWLKFLPKPGLWMENFKVAMGFPMLATAVWLLWLSATRSEEVLWLGLFLVVLSFAAWVWGRFVQRGTSGRGWAVAVCVVLLVSDYFLLARSAPDANAIAWKPWSEDAVTEAQRAGHPVLVDFTAKSCLSCQLNRISSIEIPSTRAELKKIGAVALEGDFTREDPAIARELQRFHRPGVPLVLVYSKDPNRAPAELPVLLTPSIVSQALEQAN